MKLGMLLGVFLVLGLAGCGGTKQVLTTTTKPVVVKPTESMYQCPTLGDLDKTEFDRLVVSITDPATEYDQQEVAELLWRLYVNNRTCKTSIEQIRKFIEEAAQEIEN